MIGSSERGVHVKVAAPTQINMARGVVLQPHRALARRRQRIDPGAEVGGKCYWSLPEMSAPKRRQEGLATSIRIQLNFEHSLFGDTVRQLFV